MTDEVHDDGTEVARLAAGDRAAARRLYEQHGTALLRVAQGLLGSRSRAEDALHDAFVELFRRPQGYDARRGPLFAYLCGIVRHLALRQRARESRWVSADETATTQHDGLEGAPLLDGAQPPATPEELAERDALAMRLQQACDGLPVAFREAFVLCDVEELTYEEAAGIAGCPVGTIRSRLSRARALLARTLEPNRPRGARDAARLPRSGDAADDSAWRLAAQGLTP